MQKTDRILARPVLRQRTERSARLQV